MCMFYTRQQQQKQLTAYQVLVLFCRQDFGNSGQKVSGTLEIISKKSPRFWKLLDTAFKTLETSGQSLNNFGIVTTSKVSSARWKQRIVLTMVQWFKNQAFKSSFYLQSLATQLLSVKKLTFWKWCNNHHIVFPPVFTTGGQWLQLYDITALRDLKSHNRFEMWISYTLAYLLPLPLSL